MKKSKLCIILLVAVCLMGCSGGKVSNVTKIMGESELYTEEDIMDAMKAVMDTFKEEFDGCELTKLWYEEEITVAHATGYVSDEEADEIIVILSDFYVDESGGDGSLTPNSTYENWSWTLIRNDGGAWEVKTWGYG